MRAINVFLFACLSFAGFSQNFHYFRVQMGPKSEKFEVTGNDNVIAQNHIDVGAGFMLGKRFNENLYAELGMYKNDYSSKFEVLSLNKDGEELSSFSDKVYPSFSSAQIGLNGGYRYEFTEKWTGYFQVGVQTFLSRKIEREGSQLHIEIAKNNESGYEEEINLTTYSNGLEAGNLIFKGDVGFFRVISKELALDFSVSGRTSNLPMSSYKIEYNTFSELEKKRAEITNYGKSFGFYIGLKYKFNEL